MTRDLYVRFWTHMDNEALGRRLRSADATTGVRGALVWDRLFGVPVVHEDGDELVLGLVVEDPNRRSVRKGSASESPEASARVVSDGKGPLPDKGGGAQ